MQVDEQMMQNNEIFLTHKLPLSIVSDESDPRFKVQNSDGSIPPITSISYLPGNSLLAVSFKSGQTIIGRLDTRTFELSSCIVIPTISSIKKPNAQLLVQNGDKFSNFRELNFLSTDTSKSAPQSIYLLANFSKNAIAVPVILQLS